MRAGLVSRLSGGFHYLSMSHCPRRYLICVFLFEHNVKVQHLSIPFPFLQGLAGCLRWARVATGTGAHQSGKRPRPRHHSSLPPNVFQPSPPPEPKDKNALTPWHSFHSAVPAVTPQPRVQPSLSHCLSLNRYVTTIGRMPLPIHTGKNIHTPHRLTFTPHTRTRSAAPRLAASSRGQSATRWTLQKKRTGRRVSHYYTLRGEKRVYGERATNLLDLERLDFEARADLRDGLHDAAR